MCILKWFLRFCVSRGKLLRKRRYKLPAPLLLPLESPGGNSSDEATEMMQFFLHVFLRLLTCA